MLPQVAHTHRQTHTDTETERMARTELSDIDIAYFVWLVRSSTCRPVNYGAVHVWSLSQIKPAQDLYTRPSEPPRYSLGQQQQHGQK